MKCACYARFVFPSVAANKNTKKHASIIICEWHFALCFSAICDVFWRVGKTRTDGSLRSSACAEFWCGQWFFLFVFVVKTISIFSLIIPWSIKSTKICIYFMTPFSETGAQIREKLTRDQNTILSLETMKASHCYHDALHQIWNSYIVSD